MKIKFLIPTLAVAGIFITGCYTMNTASSPALNRSRVAGVCGTPKEHVVVSNYGWYLFNTFPIACGNARGSSGFPWAFFRNDVTADVVHNRLTEYAAKKNAEVAEISFFFNDTMMFQMPFVQVPIPLPYIITYRERLVSGMLMTPEKEPVGNAAAAQDIGEDDKRKREMKRLLERIPDGGVK